MTNSIILVLSFFIILFVGWWLWIKFFKKHELDNNENNTHHNFTYAVCSESDKNLFDEIQLIPSNITQILEGAEEISKKLEVIDADLFFNEINICKDIIETLSKLKVNKDFYLFNHLDRYTISDAKKNGHWQININLMTDLKNMADFLSDQDDAIDEISNKENVR